MMKALVYRGSRGKLNRTQWRCRILGTDKNGRTNKIRFISSEGYNNEADLIDAIKELNPALEIEVQP